MLAAASVAEILDWWIGGMIKSRPVIMCLPESMGREDKPLLDSSRK